MHRIYQILDEEDNIQFMTMLDASTNNVTNETVYTSENQVQTDIKNSAESDNKTKITIKDKDEEVQVSIKTETRTGYVNIDGTDREKSKNESLGDILKEHISNYYNNTNIDENNKDTEESVNKSTAKVEVDDITIPSSVEAEKLQPPSVTKAKEIMKILPKVWLDFLTNDWGSKSKCEPQHMLERIRKEKRYPDHPDVHKYSLLLTPAPSFLQRISLAGEFLNKKQLEL